MESQANNQPTNRPLLFDDILMILLLCMESYIKQTKIVHQTTNKNQTKTNKQYVGAVQFVFNNKESFVCPSELLPPPTQRADGNGGVSEVIRVWEGVMSAPNGGLIVNDQQCDGQQRDLVIQATDASLATDHCGPHRPWLKCLRSWSGAANRSVRGSPCSRNQSSRPGLSTHGAFSQFFVCPITHSD